MAFAANGEIMPRTGTAKRTHTMETVTTGREIVPGPLGATESRDKGSLNGSVQVLRTRCLVERCHGAVDLFELSCLEMFVHAASPLKLKDELRFSPIPEDMINGTVVQS